MSDVRQPEHPPANPPPAWLERELRAWVADGLISSDQSTSIATRYAPSAAAGVRPAASAGVSMPLILVAAAIAILALGLLLLVASNWSVLSYWQRLAIVAAPGLIGAAIVPWAERADRRRIVAQFTDVIPVASLMGIAAVISQHLQQPAHDWLGLFAISLIPAVVYLEVRRNRILVSLAWASLLGFGVWWIGEDLRIREWLVRDRGSSTMNGVTNWAVYAAGMALAVRARGAWMPFLALASGGLLVVGLIVGTTLHPRSVVESTTVGVLAALVAITISAVRVWRTPTRAWTLSLIAVGASAMTLLWVNLWTELLGAPLISRAVEIVLLSEATYWIAATLTASLVVVWLGIVQRRYRERLPGWFAFRWVLLLFAVIGAVAGVGRMIPAAVRFSSHEMPPGVDMAVLVTALIAVGLTWVLLNRVTPRLAPRLAQNDARPAVLLSAGAPLAAGVVLWSLWMPLGRLIGIALPSGAGTIVSLAEWGVTILAAVWVVALLADQAGRERRWGARVAWGLVVIVSVVLLIEAFTRQDSLLERGLTFTAVSIAMLAGVLVSRWRGRSVPRQGPDPRIGPDLASEVVTAGPVSDRSPPSGSRRADQSSHPGETDDDA